MKTGKPENFSRTFRKIKTKEIFFIIFLKLRKKLSGFPAFVFACVKSYIKKLLSQFI